MVFNDFKGMNECPRCGEHRMDGVRCESIEDGSPICTICAKAELIDEEGVEMDPSSGIKWSPPPAEVGWKPGMPMKGRKWIRAMLASLEANPGRWALVRETSNKSNSPQKEWQGKYGQHGFAFVQHPNDQGGWDIYGIYGRPDDEDDDEQ